jgi:hypothetical protein
MSTLLVENIRHEDSSDIAIVLSSNGTLGIGTVGTARNDPLTVKGLNNIAKFESSAAAVELRINTPTVDKIGLTTGTNDNFFINVGSGDRLYIKNNGNVGIDTPSPNEKLSVKGNIELYNDEQDGYIWFHDAGTRSWTMGSQQSSGNFVLTNTVNIGSNEQLVVTGAGNVGIGTANPLEKLQVNFTSTETHQSTLTKNTNTPGAWIVNQNNDDNMAGIHLATGSGTHFSSIVGARTNNSAHWGTHLAFYTHRNDTANLNTADERMRLDGSGSLEQYGSSVKSMYFPVFLESTQTHHIATATNLNNSTVVIATLEFATLYAYAGSQHSMGTIWASARRTNNNTAWRELNQATVNIGDTSYTPGFYWDTSNGQLKCTVGGSVQVTGFIRITYHSCDMIRVTN